MINKKYITKKNIVFDFWGTIANLCQGPDFGQLISELLCIQKKEYLQLVENYWFSQFLSADQFADILIGNRNIPRSMRKKLINLIVSPIDRASLYSDSLPCLNHLSRSHKLFIVSDNSSNGEAIIKKLKIEYLFEETYLSCRLGITKKNGLYRHFFKLVPPEQTIVIGDSFIADINEALRCGADAIHIDRNINYDSKKSIHTLRVLI